jgi:putative FmdB family regulatory protein
MPFYEYQCQACSAQVEVLQKISDAPLKKCPECGKLRLRKLVSAPVFRLKGAGWYETDFKSDKESKRNLVETEKGGEEKSGATADAKADTKADTKSDAKPAEKSAEKPAEKSADKSVARSPEKSASKSASRSRPKPAARRAAPARKGKHR